MAKKKTPKRQKTPPRKVKEPWRLSKRGKWGLIAGAVAALLIAIVWIVVYNMQALPLDSEGKIITAEGQNWLVYNEKTKSNPRYLKLGEIAPAEGYTLDKVDSISDANEPVYYFKPESGDASAITYGALVGKSDYKSIADSTVASVSSMLIEGTASEVISANLSGKNVAYYLYSGGMPDAQEQEKIDYYAKQLNAYAQAPNGKSVVFMIEQHSDTGTDYADDQAFLDVLEKALAGLTL